MSNQIDRKEDKAKYSRTV